MQELRSYIMEQMTIFAQDSQLQVEKGNNAAGARSRKSAMELRKLLKNWRVKSVEAAQKKVNQ